MYQDEPGPDVHNVDDGNSDDGDVDDDQSGGDVDDGNSDGSGTASAAASCGDAASERHSTAEEHDEEAQLKRPTNTILVRDIRIYKQQTDREQTQKQTH